MFEEGLVLENQGLWAHFPWKVLPFKHGFSTVLAGNMSMRFGTEKEVADNLEKFFQMVGHFQEETVIINPQHEDEILFFEKYPTIFYPECDGVITAVPKIGIGLILADCLPVILWGKIEGRDFVGLVHAGRRGTKLKITERAINLLIDRGAKAEEINVAIGPGIHSCCYKFAGMKIDLVKRNIQQALDRGVSIANIVVAKECTFCAKGPKSLPLFFSHRRANKQKEKEGRFIALIVLERVL